MLTKMKGAVACQKSITDNGNTELETTSCVKELFVFIQIWVYFLI